MAGECLNPIRREPTLKKNVREATELQIRGQDRVELQYKKLGEELLALVVVM